jgi:hypothetical protein
MSARRATALLMIVALSLLLASGSALSRPEIAPRDGFDGSNIVTKDDDVGPDDFDPGDGAVGDDDNWDKPMPGVHGPVDAMAGAGDGLEGETCGTKPEDVRGLTALIWMGLLFSLW